MGNIAKHCGCLVQMKECYDRLGKQDMVDIYTKRISDIEGELRNKLGKIKGKLSGMTDRLRMSSAALEMVVEMERWVLCSSRPLLQSVFLASRCLCVRITPVILDLRSEVDRLHAVLELQEEEREGQQEKVDKVERLLDGIQAEVLCTELLTGH